MFDPKKLDELRAAQDHWNQTTLPHSANRVPARRDGFTTISGRPVQRVYTPLDVPDLDYLDDLGLPGEYPFTRGVHATGYRGKLWTMRMFAGFGTAEETNARYKYLLAQGNMGLSVAFDLPTLMGYDTDAPEALGEFGKCGVAISSLRDMEILFDGIPLGEVSTSMTINSPAAILWAFYIAAAEKQGVPMAALRGTLQNDILKEYQAQKEYIFPPEPSMRLVTDTIEYRHALSARVEHDQHQRLPHPRGGSHRRAGTRLHAGQRAGICALGAAARAGHRRLRAPAELLLQRA